MKNKIDIKKWKEFKIGDLFDIHPTKSYKMNNSSLMTEDGINPVVVNSCYNNGIGGYTNYECTESGNMITFSDTTSADSIFYQKNSFVGYPHVQGMYPIGEYKDKWSEYIYLFFVTLFREKAIDLNYDYVNKFTRESAKEIMIKLPVDNKNNPDWKYMKEYMKNIEDKSRKAIKKLNNCEEDTTPIDITEWKEFHLYDIFDIDSGSKMDRIAMKFDNPTINFVGRSGINNGVTAVVDEVKEYLPYKAGNLTLALGGAYLGSCFVQEKDFYTSQNVVVLIPKEDISFYAKEFICAVIFKEGNTHYKAFIDELNRHIKTDFVIKLPIDSYGKPNYEYMDKYMIKLLNKTKNKLNYLNNI